jgi:hypothetical protein
MSDPCAPASERAALIRPDGHIGFRFPAADAAALAVLDRHLSSYLIPDPTVAPFETANETSKTE